MGMSQLNVSSASVHLSLLETIETVIDALRNSFSLES